MTRPLYGIVLRRLRA